MIFPPTVRARNGTASGRVEQLRPASVQEGLSREKARRRRVAVIHDLSRRMEGLGREQRFRSPGQEALAHHERPAVPHPVRRRLDRGLAPGDERAPRVAAAPEGSA